MISLLFLLLLAQEPKIISCEVVGPSTVTCEGDTKPFSVNWENHPEWLVVMSHPDAKPELVKPVIGQKLKAEVRLDGSVWAIESCEVRRNKRVKEWARLHPEERVPGTMWEMPKDCVIK